MSSTLSYWKGTTNDTTLVISIIGKNATTTFFSLVAGLELCSL